MTKSFLLSFFLLLSLVIFSQQGDGGFPKTFKEVIDYNKIDKRVFDEPNIAALKIEDSLTDNSGTAPWRFGFIIIRISTSQILELGLIYQMEIEFGNLLLFVKMH